MSEDYSGIVGAPVTPFTSDNKVDLATFAKQINFLIENGVSLIAHPMHIGESVNMTDQERKDLARVMVEAAAGRVPTFVHVSHAGTDLSVDLAQYADKVGATGVVTMAPYHWKPSQDVIIDHFKTIASSIKGKLIVYNNPNATGVPVTPEMFRQLLDEIPSFVAMKDASFDMKTFTDFCVVNEDSGRNIALYTGIELLLTSVPAGGRGCFSACAEVAPKATVELFKICSGSDMAAARKAQYRMRKILSLMMENYPATIKYSMELLGRPVGITRKPIMPLDEAAKARAKRLLEELGVMDSEPHGW
tara:strand:+ start:128 stop:1039 length:912 start_codon:yes stop_codon:yes gene_type:complete